MKSKIKKKEKLFLQAELAHSTNETFSRADWTLSKTFHAGRKKNKIFDKICLKFW